MTIVDIKTKGTAGWQSISSLASEALGETFTFESGKKYYFQVKSDCSVTFNNSTTTPTDESGVILDYGDQLIALINSGDMYVDSHNGDAIINISKED